jgi:hypothetical protein
MTAPNSTDEKLDAALESATPPSELHQGEPEPEPSAEGSETPLPQPARKVTGISWLCVVVAVLAPFFLFALDNTIVADVQPQVVEDLGEIQKLPWISVAFALGAVSVNLIWSVNIFTGAKLTC